MNEDISFLEITSFSNEKLKHISNLKEKKHRETSGLFFIEGYREILRAQKSGKVRFENVLFSPECFLGENEFSLIRSIGAKNIKVPKKVFEKISYRDRPDGLIATARFFPVGLDFFRKESNSLKKSKPILVIEGVEKTGKPRYDPSNRGGRGISFRNRRRSEIGSVQSERDPRIHRSLVLSGGLSRRDRIDLRNFKGKFL